MTAVLYDAVGPRGRRRILGGSVVGGAVLLAVLAVVLVRLAEKGQLDSAQWSVLTNVDFLNLLRRGMVATLKVAVVAMALSVAAGGLFAVGRLSTRAWLRWPAGAIVELFRGLPLLLLILFAFLALPALGISVSAFWALVIGLTVYNSAVICEIFRAGILSLDAGQSEAAYAIGLRRAATLRLILVPQAVRRMLPVLVSQLVTLLKDTSLGFVIGYEELLRRGQEAVDFLGSRHALPIYTAVALVYIIVNTALSYLARRLERRQRTRYGAGAVLTRETAPTQEFGAAPGAA